MSDAQTLAQVRLLAQRHCTTAVNRAEWDRLAIPPDDLDALLGA